MRSSEHIEYDAIGLASLVIAGEVTPVELTRLTREAHHEVNPRINAVVEFYEDAEAVAGADAGSLNGVPFFRKNLGAVAGRLQEKGSRMHIVPIVESPFPLPSARLADILARIAAHPAQRIDDLLPWNWRCAKLRIHPAAA